MPLGTAGLTASPPSSSVQKRLANLKKAGRLRRVGPDKGGHLAVK